MIYQWSPCVSGAAYVLGVDWAGDGNFTSAGDDVTADVLSSGITVAYGRDQDRQLSPPAVGRSGFELCNESRAYSPENVDSPLFGNLGAARPVRFAVTFAGSSYDLFHGRLDDFDVRADREQRSVAFTALDGLALLQGATLSTALYRGLRTGDVVNLILDEIGWTAARAIDPGATIVPWWWEEDTNAFDALEKVLQSEGPPSIGYVDAAGTFVYRDRHHRLLDPVARTSQATFAAGRSLCDSPPVTGFSYTAPFAYQHGWRDIVNSATFAVGERQADAQLSSVWSSSDTYTIQDGGTITLDVQANDPFFDVTTDSVRLTFSGTPPGIGTVINRSSGQAVTLAITAMGGVAVITSVELIARSVPVVRTRKISAEDSVSIAQHGRREYPNPAPWANAEDAFAIANLVLGHYAQRRPTVQIRVVAQDPAHLLQILTRRISDKITIRNDEMGLVDDFHIESISHEVRRIDPRRGPVHAVVFGCERDLTAQSSNPFTFDKAGAGFDDGYFGVSGLDDPGSVFIFDHVTQGKFNVGLFGT